MTCVSVFSTFLSFFLNLEENRVTDLFDLDSEFDRQL